MSEDPRSPKVIDLSLLDDLNEDECLEFMVATFTKMLILKKFADKRFYGELIKRIGRLINVELIWQEKHENDQALMQYFYPEVN